MSAPSHSLAERYGAPRQLRQWIPLVGLVVLIVIAIGAGAFFYLRGALFQSDPPVSSQLISFEIVDDHTAIGEIRVKWGDDPLDAQCTVRAIAHDKAVVGEETVEVGEDGDHRVEIATERRATAVENVGCTAEGQRRPR